MLYSYHIILFYLLYYWPSVVLKLANHLWSTGMHRPAASGQEALFDHLKKGHSAVLVGQVGQDQRNGEAQRNGKNWGNVAALESSHAQTSPGSQMVPWCTVYWGWVAYPLGIWDCLGSWPISGMWQWTEGTSNHLSRKAAKSKGLKSPTSQLYNKTM
jgi:hypothetical protein